MTQFKRAMTDGQKVERRQRILDAAKELFYDYEFADISINKIASLAHVSKGTVFIYFHTKEEIFIDLLIDEFESWSASFSQELSSKTSDSWIEKLKFMAKDNELLLRLLSISNAVLEYNISQEKAFEYRSLFENKLQELGRLLDDLIDFFLPGDGGSFMMYCFIVITGLHNITNPAPLLQKVVQEHNMHFYEVDFNQALTSMLETQLQGIKVRNEPEKGDCIHPH